MKFPWLASLLVGAAVAAMIGLGVWQLQRAAWKQGLLARYEAAAQLPEIGWPTLPANPESVYFRRASGFCLEIVGWRAIAGRNIKDQTGWAHIAACRTGAEGPGMQVDMGWSQSSDPPAWRGGPVSGVIAPDSKYRLRLIATAPAPGLLQSAPPTPASIPNNHMLYAVQWFLFAGIAAIIYAIAWRRRAREAKVAGDGTSG